MGVGVFRCRVIVKMGNLQGCGRACAQPRARQGRLEDGVPCSLFALRRNRFVAVSEPTERRKALGYIFVARENPLRPSLNYAKVSRKSFPFNDL